MFFIFFLFTFPFILWSIMGGNKQEVIGFNSDHVVTIYTLFSCALLAIYLVIKKNHRFKKSHVFYALLLGVYFTVNILIYGKNNVTIIITHTIYIAISLLFIFIFKNKPKNLSYLIALGLFFVSSFLLIKLYDLGFGGWGRLTVPVISNGIWSYFPHGYESSSDPNVLAFMLCISSIYVFFTLPNKKIINLVFLLSMSCSLLTLSRSSFLSFVISLFVVSLYSYIKFNKIPVRLLSIFALSVIFSFTIIKTVPHTSESTESTESTVSERIISERSDSDRVIRLKNAIEELSNVKTFFSGNGIGYSTSNQDPHNFYLSTIIDSGIIVLLMVITIIIKPLILILKKIRNENILLGCMFLTIYFFFISLFYWQVRVLYFSITLLFILVNINEKKNG